MNWRGIIFLAGAVMWTACGCTTVADPVGEFPVQLDPMEWNGVWMFLGDGDDLVMSVEVVDGDSGVLRVFHLDGKEPRFVSVYLRRSGQQTFASVPYDEWREEVPYDPAAGFAPRDPDDVDRYVWARINRHRRHIFGWAPDTDRFRELIEAGELPGAVDGSDAALGGRETNDLADIMQEGALSLFEWDDPGVFIRISDDLP